MGVELVTDGDTGDTGDTGAVVASPTAPGRSPVGAGRRPSLPRIRRRLFPYLLLVPALVGLGAGVVWPIYRMAVMSTQEFGLAQNFGTEPPEFIGLENFRDIFGDTEFWAVLRRSLIFMIVNVALTMALGTLVALLLSKLGRVMRFGLTVAMLLVWAAPPLTASILWQWMFDTRFGIVNEALTSLGFGGFDEHNWLAEPITFYLVATIIVVWMGLPFVAFTLYAAMTQVSGEVVEAAKIDGAGAFQRFRDVTWPAIKPVFLVMTMLSTVWDLRVFTQIFVLQEAGGLVRDTNLLGTWGFRTAVVGSDFGQGAASAVVLVAITVSLTAFYIRQLFRRGEVT
jgi:N,N'-diacetylchitobiose transport system permease protein